MMVKKIPQVYFLLLVLISANCVYSQKTADSYIKQAKIQCDKYNKDKEMFANCLPTANQALELLDLALKEEPNNLEAKELSIQLNNTIGIDYLSKGKNNLQKDYSSNFHKDVYSGWYDGYYFYTSLEYFANAYTKGMDSNAILSHLKEIDSIEQLDPDNNLIRFTLDNLPKISSAEQKNTIEQITKLKSKIEQNKDTITKNKLLNYYTELVNLEKYHFSNGKFAGGSYREARIAKAKLNIELGNVNEGCEELFYADVDNFMFSHSCPSGCEEYTKKLHLQYIAEEKAKAKQWNVKNPDKIIFSSLFGEGSTTVEAYLGAPIKELPKINLGSGVNYNQYIGKLYKGKYGTYEIGFNNGNVVLIKFTPSISLPFTVESMEHQGKKSKIDFECQYMKSSCSVDQNKEHTGGSIQTFTINYDCSQSDGYIRYFGQNGKVLSIAGYFFK